MHREQDISLLEILNEVILKCSDLHPRFRWDKRTKQAIAVTPAIPNTDVEHFIIKRLSGDSMRQRHPYLLYELTKSALLSPWLLWHSTSLA